MTLHICICWRSTPTMGWLWLVASIKLQVSFAKETYKRDDILQKRRIILSILPTVATPYSVGPEEARALLAFGCMCVYIYTHTYIYIYVYMCMHMLYVCRCWHSTPSAPSAPRKLVHCLFFELRTCVYTFIYINIHVHICMVIHFDIHVHTHARTNI